MSHLILFGFIYPSDRDRVPAWVMRSLIERLEAELARPAPAERVCCGTLLSLMEYMPDVNWGGYTDARSGPQGTLSDRAVDQMTKDFRDGE